ncbi:MBL fold metallo-hydrolase [Flavobacterium frigidarium]|uniref:MBL fold metallo-hydrolase n=1 Tax=Flavobacterium frigidarium TaxID=99286 RepID=UPI0030DC382A|tara:strand:- start:2328 stop:3278 length:951 start_codon:yes stop_codon:yes gene_type:complete
MKKYLILTLIFLGISVFAQEKAAHLTATIIGSGSPKFSTERSGPSVLISYEDTQILVDMGNGTQANLDKNSTKIRDIDGLLFTHHHLNHNEEFAPIFIQSLLGGTQTIIAGPPKTKAIIDNFIEIYDEDIEYRLSKSGRTLSQVKQNFKAVDLAEENPFYIGAIKVSYVKVNHTIATLAYRFDVAGESIVVSGDLTYSENLPVLANNADYLIIDSGGAIAKGSKTKNMTDRGAQNKSPVYKKSQKTGTLKSESTKEKAHVNLAESSLMAKDANVKNMVLTHFNSASIDEEATTAEIRKNFKGTILFAQDLMVLPQR